MQTIRVEAGLPENALLILVSTLQKALAWSWLPQGRLKMKPMSVPPPAQLGPKPLPQGCQDF